jgi:hypothetical protein
MAGESPVDAANSSMISRTVAIDVSGVTFSPSAHSILSHDTTREKRRFASLKLPQFRKQ